MKNFKSKKIYNFNSKLMYAIVIIFLLHVVISSFMLPTISSATDDKNSTNKPSNTSDDKTSSINVSELGNDLDKITESIMKTLKKNNSRLGEYIPSEKQKKYLKCFIQADIATRSPDKSGRTPDETKELMKKEDYNELQGRVYLYRYDKDGKETLMKYVEKSKFDELVSNNDDSIKYKFTLNESNDIVIPTVSYVTNSSDNTSTTVGTTTVSYRDQLRKYALPFDYLWALTVMSQEANFVYKLAELGRDSEFRIAVHDNYTKTTVVTTDTYGVNNIKVTETWEKTENGSKRTGESESTTQSTRTSESTSVREDNTVSVGYTYANSWIALYERKYTRKEDTTTSTNTRDNLNDFSTERKSTGTDIGDTEKVYTYEQIVSHSQKIDTTVYTVKYTEEKATIKEKVDKDKDTDENFVKLLSRYEKAQSNLFSASSWLFEVLKKNERTEALIDITKYLFYKTTGTSFGVKELGDMALELELASSMNSVNGFYGGSLQEKVWWALKDLGYSDIAVAGAMGNFAQESGFQTNNLENIFESKLGYTDESYTAAVDNGTYSLAQFTSDHDLEGCGAGYGLVQWTWGTRKEGLYKFAKSKGVSIADEDMQIAYLVGELTPGGGADGYASYALSSGQGYGIDDWKNANDIEVATRAFCGVFEKGGWAEYRLSKAKEFYEEFKGKKRPDTGTETTSNVPGILGTYTSISNGRTFTRYIQNGGSSCPWDWYEGCYITGQAVLISGFGFNVTPDKLPGFGGEGSLSTFGQYGLQYTNENYNVNASDMANELKAGKVMMVRIQGGNLITDNGSHTYSMHIVNILDYKNENGIDRVYIHDPWNGNNTYGWANLQNVANAATWYSCVWK